MSKSATELAKKLLETEKNDFEEIRIHMFRNDLEAHDDSSIERLYAEFTKDFERTEAELTAAFGGPVSTGESNETEVPLCGVFHFSVWDISGRRLFVAAAHEDRGCPILLLLGTRNK